MASEPSHPDRRDDEQRPERTEVEPRELAEAPQVLRRRVRRLAAPRNRHLAPNSCTPKPSGRGRGQREPPRPRPAQSLSRARSSTGAIATAPPRAPRAPAGRKEQWRRRKQGTDRHLHEHRRGAGREQQIPPHAAARDGRCGHAQGAANDGHARRRQRHVGRHGALEDAGNGRTIHSAAAVQPAATSDLRRARSHSATRAVPRPERVPRAP